MNNNTPFLDLPIKIAHMTFEKEIKLRVMITVLKEPFKFLADDVLISFELILCCLQSFEKLFNAIKTLANMNFAFANHHPAVSSLTRRNSN